MYVVSACLIGVKCRYDGEGVEYPSIQQLVEQGQAIPVCPEVLGGLSTPRFKCEIVRKGDQKRVINEKGEDVTDAFAKGAEMTLKIAQAINAKKAILKSKSPSCGCQNIYDGTFSGKLIEDLGVTAKLLTEKGIEVMNEKDYMDSQKELK